MALQLTFATEVDASCIADIHMAAFATNEMLLAQFPTPSVRQALWTCIAKKAADDIRDPHTAVLLIKDKDLNGEIISFAKWNLPTSSPTNEAPWIWPEGTRIDILHQWTEKVESAKDLVVKDISHYRTCLLHWSCGVRGYLQFHFVARLVYLIFTQ